MLKDYLNQAQTMIKKRPLLLIIVPWLLYAVYLTLIAAPKYESTSQLVVKSADGANNFDPSALLMSGMTGAPASNESQLVVAFIQSNDMLHYLDKAIDLSGHYTSSEGDIISRLASDHSNEAFLEYYLNNIDVLINSDSSVIELSVRAYNPEYAQLISQTIVKRAEQFINEISNNLAKSRLATSWKTSFSRPSWPSLISNQNTMCWILQLKVRPFSKLHSLLKPHSLRSKLS